MTIAKSSVYGAYHRGQVARKSSMKSELVKAFSNAWRDGDAINIMLTHDGSVRATCNRKEVAYYADAEDFAKDFMPELLEDYR